MRFAGEIMKEEWRDFEKRHRDVISRKTERRTGNLEDNRKYTTKREGNAKVVSSFRHPVYERFIDMKKNYMGDWKSSLGTKQDLMVRRSGRAIHNRIIFGKLNPISFRLMHELRDQVRAYWRDHFKKKSK